MIAPTMATYKSGVTHDRHADRDALYWSGVFATGFTAQDR